MLRPATESEQLLYCSNEPPTTIQFTHYYPLARRHHAPHSPSTMSSPSQTLSLLVLLLAAYGSCAAKTKPQICLLPHSVDGYTEPNAWRCHGQLPLWSYSQAANECVEFIYGGCGGNDNTFYSRADCEETCRG